MKNQTYSVLSGLFASLASLSGKFALGGEEALWLCEVLCGYVENGANQATVNRYPACKDNILYIRAIFFAMMILFNSIMWTTFVKALRYSRTSLEATVTNTAANFFFTAIFSQVLFGEFLTLVWWVGTLLILFGLLVMHKGNQEAAAVSSKKKK